MKHDQFGSPTVSKQEWHAGITPSNRVNRRAAMILNTAMLLSIAGFVIVAVVIFAALIFFSGHY